MNYFDVESQLYELQKVCNRYSAVDPLADWVLAACWLHYDSGRMTRNFQREFCNLDSDGLLGLVQYCLNSNRSYEEMISNAVEFLGRRKK